MPLKGRAGRFPFLITTGFDYLLDSHAVHVAYGPQRWALTSTQARELASALLHAAVHLDRLARASRGA